MLETLKTRLPWAEMGFDAILTAASMPEGKRLLGQQGADFLLLDVEVIRGTGIELLQWARAHGFDAECVFLTNHADFGYAKEAVRLGSVDYVLKTEPLSEVERAVRRAIAKRHPDILFDADKEQRETIYETPDTLKERMTHWEQLLMDDQRTQLLGDVRTYLAEREAQGDNHSGIRMVLQHDMTQLVYRQLQRYGLQASAMFECEEDTLSYRNASSSTFDTLKWLNRFLTRFAVLTEAAQKQQSVAEKAHIYIEEHYAEDINRQKLAELLFVNSDHLSHLFSREYGLSLPDFIARTRIEEAKRLLKGGATVSEAAMQVGYDNFAYFSTVFKKINGVSPSDFRKQYGGRNG